MTQGLESELPGEATEGGIMYKNLWNLMRDTYDMSLLESELTEIAGAARKDEETTRSEAPNEADFYGVWVSVKNSLPNEFDHVLVSIESEGEEKLVTKGFFDGDHWHSDTFGKHYTTEHITRWMPLPEAQ